MWTCAICHFTAELDDVMLRGGGSGQCVCLRCYGRETGTERPMPKALQREVSYALAAVELS